MWEVVNESWKKEEDKEKKEELYETLTDVRIGNVLPHH